MTNQVGGASYAVALAGTHAFLGVGSRVLVLDVATPAAPQRVGASPILAGTVRDIALAGTLAFVALGRGGLAILDVSDLAHPRLVSQFELPRLATRVMVGESVAYVADPVDGSDGAGRLWVVDVSAPGRPVELGQIAVPAIRDVARSATHLYVAGRSALDVFSLADPRRPALEAHRAGGGDAAVVEAGWLYVLGEGSLRAYDLALPGEPKLAAEASLAWTAHGLSVAGDRAYVVGGAGFNIAAGPGTGWFRIIDLAALRAARAGGSAPLLASYTIPYEAIRIQLSGRRAFVVETFGGLSTFELGADDRATRVGGYRTVGWVDEVAARGDIGLVMVRGGGLKAVDLTEPDRPVVRGTFGAADDATLTVAGDYAYIDGTDVVTVGPRGELTPYGTLPEGVVAAGPTHAYVLQTGLSAGLHVFDMTGPRGPRDVLRLSGLRATPLAVVGNHLYMADGNFTSTPFITTLKDYALTDPRRPVEVRSLVMPDQYWTPAEFTDQRAYVETRADDVEVLEIGGPVMRRGAGKIPLPGHCGSFAADGLSVWTALSNVAVYDVTDADAPNQVAALALPGRANGIFAQGERAYIAAGSAGLVVVELVDRPLTTATPTRTTTPGATTTATSPPSSTPTAASPTGTPERPLTPLYLPALRQSLSLDAP